MRNTSIIQSIMALKMFLYQEYFALRWGPLASFSDLKMETGPTSRLRWTVYLVFQAIAPILPVIFRQSLRIFYFFLLFIYVPGITIVKETKVP